MEQVLPYDDNNNHLLVNYLIGAEMVYATIIHQCFASGAVNHHRPARVIFCRHHEIVLQLLERLANMASVSPVSPSALAHLVSGSHWLEPFKPLADDETSMDKVFQANTLIIQFMKVEVTQIKDKNMQELCMDVERAHKKMGLELALLFNC